MTVGGQALVDSQNLFLEGADASTNPATVSANGFYGAFNVTTKAGWLGPRWGIDLNEFTFKDSKTEEEFYEGKVQAFAPYITHNSHYLLVVVSGAIYLADVDRKKVSRIDGAKVDPYMRRVPWSEADKFFTIFDSPAYPVILEGITARRADPTKKEIPISVLGALTQNRLGVANEGSEFTFGDPSGDPATPDAPITFKEVLTPATSFYKQFFRFPTKYANMPITAMGYLQLGDTATGIGPSILATKDVIIAAITNTVRANWTQGVFSTVIIPNFGIANQRAQTNVNSDLYLIDNDYDLHSIAMAREEQQSKWTRVPITPQVKPYLKQQEPLADVASLTYFKNKIFMTANPYRTTAKVKGKTVSDFAHMGFAVLELDNVSKFLQDSKPAWAGIWTGVRPMDSTVLNGVMYIIGKDEKNRNKIYEFTPEKTYDKVPHVRQIVSRVYTREYDFKDSTLLKNLQSANIQLGGLKGDFHLDVEYKPSHYSGFVYWGGLHKNFAKIPVFKGLFAYTGRSYRKVVIGSPNEENSNFNKEPLSVLTAAQLKITITGMNWKLKGLKLNAVTANDQDLQTDSDKLEEVCEGELIKSSDDWYLEGRYEQSNC